jgi:hypothetical protein
MDKLCGLFLYLYSCLSYTYTRRFFLKKKQVFSIQNVTIHCTNKRKKSEEKYHQQYCCLVKINKTNRYMEINLSVKKKIILFIFYMFLFI